MTTNDGIRSARRALLDAYTAMARLDEARPLLGAAEPARRRRVCRDAATAVELARSALGQVERQLAALAEDADERGAAA